MNRVISNPSNYEYLTIDFRVSRSILENAMIDSDELRIIVAKVICYSVIIFLLIATFESIVINGAKLLLNPGIWALNTGNFLLSGCKSQELLTIPLVPALPPVDVKAGDAQIPIPDEPLPPLLLDQENEFRKVFKILATSNVFQLAYHRSYLVDFRERTKHLHPLQVMGFLLEINSNQKKDAALFIDSYVGSTFVQDTLAGFANPLHSQNTAKYIVSFAEKVGVSPDAVRGFLFQEPPYLKDLIHYIIYCIHK